MFVECLLHAKHCKKCFACAIRMKTTYMLTVSFYLPPAAEEIFAFAHLSSPTSLLFKGYFIFVNYVLKLQGFKIRRMGKQRLHRYLRASFHCHFRSAFPGLLYWVSRVPFYLAAVAHFQCTCIYSALGAGPETLHTTRLLCQLSLR